jgi:hypothetical protein
MCYIFVCLCVCARARGWGHACVCVRVRVYVYVSVGAQARACSFGRVALIVQLSTRGRHIICDLPRSTTFFGIISQMARFSGKKLLNVKYVFWFSQQPLFEIFLILKIIQRDIFINVKTSSHKARIILVGF